MRAGGHGAIRSAAEGLTVGFYSPMPPAKTGVADYAAALLNGLRATAGPQTAVTVVPNERIQNRPRTSGLPYIGLYHVGNNSLHRAIYRAALQDPGVVVLHDAVLQHFFLGSLSQHEYIDEFVYNYGGWYSGLAQTLWTERARSASDARYFSYPMLKRIAEISRAVVVHNPAAAAMVRSHAPNAVIHEIPHLFVAPALPPAYAVERLRSDLGVNAKFVFGVFGHLRESKRLNAVLRAFEVVRRSADVAVLVAGDFASSDLERAVGRALSGSAIIRKPYLSERDFWLHAAAVDACINLRYPAAGETSGVAIRLMGIGKPVILSQGVEASEYPDAACIQVETGAREQAMLDAAMLWLAQSRADAVEIGARARTYVREHHAIERVAASYWRVLEEAALL